MNGTPGWHSRVSAVAQRFSKQGPQNSFSITWIFVRNADSWSPSQTCQIDLVLNSGSSSKLTDCGQGLFLVAVGLRSVFSQAVGLRPLSVRSVPQGPFLSQHGCLLLGQQKNLCCCFLSHLWAQQIRSGPPDIISLLIKSKSTDKYLDYICKIPLA